MIISTLNGLKKRVDKQNKLKVQQDGGEVFTSTFYWESPWQGCEKY
ncbi:hypothetical protein [Paenibacillus sp. V4I7]|nr:hypothetical protein [Paenibacillus sp. V4I7]MDQ0897580.1 hypothetical protein [Paenibacillus sp. V4I7]